MASIDTHTLRGCHPSIADDAEPAASGNQRLLQRNTPATVAFRRYYPPFLVLQRYLPRATQTAVMRCKNTNVTSFTYQFIPIGRYYC